MRWLVAPIYAFVLFAPLVVLLYSLSPTVVLELPPEGITLRWYANLANEPRLLRGLVVSVVTGAAATAAALLAGVPAAVALSRSRRRWLQTLFLSPLVVPGIVLALGILMSLSTWLPGLVGTVWPLAASHVLVTLPWVIRTVSASLELTDPALEDAARGLGAGPVEAFFLVTLPSIRPGIVTGAVFAFIVSFGNFALSLFFASGSAVTLPVAIFEYIDRFQDPTVAAASSLVILGTTVTVVLVTRDRRGELP